jgi:predicted acylesterase/phospholipase RssA
MRYQLNMSDQISNIALSLSGGGYRAAAFHLGCMKCLNDEIRHEAPLLSRLAILSSISGGTITAVVYAHTLARGRSFQEFYEAVKDFLHRDELLNRAFGKLNNPDAWKAYPMKQRNLINAFALVYD